MNLGKNDVKRLRNVVNIVEQEHRNGPDQRPGPGGDTAPLQPVDVTGSRDGDSGMYPGFVQRHLAADGSYTDAAEVWVIELEDADLGERRYLGRRSGPWTDGKPVFLVQFEDGTLDATSEAIHELYGGTTLHYAEDVEGNLHVAGEQVFASPDLTNTFGSIGVQTDGGASFRLQFKPGGPSDTPPFDVFSLSFEQSALLGGVVKKRLLLDTLTANGVSGYSVDATVPLVYSIRDVDGGGGAGAGGIADGQTGTDLIGDVFCGGLCVGINYLGSPDPGDVITWNGLAAVYAPPAGLVVSGTPGEGDTVVYTGGDPTWSPPPPPPPPYITAVADTDTVDLTVTTGTLTADVRYQMSITSDAGGLLLVGDEADPGPNMVYSTDGDGAKGWHAAGGGDDDAPGSPGQLMYNGDPAEAAVTSSSYDDASKALTLTGGGAEGSAPLTVVNTISPHTYRAVFGNVSAGSFTRETGGGADMTVSLCDGHTITVACGSGDGLVFVVPGGGTVGIGAPDSGVGDGTVYQLPADDGSPGDVLTTDGAGVTSWETPVAGAVADGDYGDVVVSSSGAVWTIDANVVTYAKMQATSAASRLLGRGAGSGAGNVQEITLGSGLSLTGTVLSVSGGPGSPGGVDTDVQVNDGAGGFHGDTNFQWDYTGQRLLVAGRGQFTAVSGGGQADLAGGTYSASFSVQDVQVDAVDLLLSNSANLTTGGSTGGSQIGLNSSEKWGYWGATPVARQAANLAMTDSTGGGASTVLYPCGDTTASDQSMTLNYNFASVYARLAEIRALLLTTGLGG